MVEAGFPVCWVTRAPGAEAKDLPLGVKIYVTILLLLAMRGGVRMITEARSQAVRE